VIHVSEADFQARVLDASAHTPVVVDFWAGWCQPCLVLGPVLERLAAEYDGGFILAKVDVDDNPRLAAAFGVQGIPAVKAFRDGRVVSDFVGVLPEDAVRRFLDHVLPSEADELAARGQEAEAGGNPEEAERHYRKALALSSGHRVATLGLARLAAPSDPGQARSLLGSIPPDEEVRRVLSELDLRAAADGSGALADAAAAFERGEPRAALEGLLEILARGDGDRDAAREQVIKIFDILGPEDPLTREFRPRLASALF
jgi:putative thioredoxin